MGAKSFTLFLCKVLWVDVGFQKSEFHNSNDLMLKCADTISTVLEQNKNHIFIRSI